MFYIQLNLNVHMASRGTIQANRLQQLKMEYDWFSDFFACLMATLHQLSSAHDLLGYKNDTTKHTKLETN